jgi:hypothetical protein
LIIRIGKNTFKCRSRWNLSKDSIATFRDVWVLGIGMNLFPNPITIFVAGDNELPVVNL